MKNIHDHIIDKQVAEALQGHEIAPSAGAWARITRHLPFINSSVYMPWYYSARNVAVVALFISMISFGGGYFIATYSGNETADLLEIPNENLTANAQSNNGETVKSLGKLAGTDGNQELAINNLSSATNSTKQGESTAKGENNKSMLLSFGYQDSEFNKNDDEQDLYSRNGIGNNSNPNYLNENSGNGDNLALNLASDIRTEKINSEGGSDLNLTGGIDKTLPIVDENKTDEVATIIAEDNADKSENDFEVNGGESKIEMPKTRLFGFEFGIALMAFDNLNGRNLSKLSSEKTAGMAISTLDMNPRLDLGFTIGNHFTLRSGLGLRTMNFGYSGRFTNVNYRNPSGPSGSPSDISGEMGSLKSTYTLQTLQVPIMLGLSHNIGKLHLEVFGGTVYTKVFSQSGISIAKYDDKPDGSAGDVYIDDDVNSEFSSAFITELSAGIGYNFNSTVSITASPFYQFSKSKIQFSRDAFNPSSFGGALAIRVRL